MLEMRWQGADRDDSLAARAAGVAAVQTRAMPIVGAARIGRAMLLLAVLLGISVSAVLYDHNGWDFLGSTALGAAPAGIVRMGASLAPLVVVSITLMVLVVEGGTMVADAFRKQLQERARQRGREEGLAEGRKAGLAEGQEKGLAAERARWQDWLARKQAAELENRPFDEPPPGTD